MRVAVNSRRKDQSGQWVDKPNFFDVVVFGAQGENCANYLSRGRPVAVEGRLDWREWEAKEGGGKRQAVQIIANTRPVPRLARRRRRAQRRRWRWPGSAVRATRATAIRGTRATRATAPRQSDVPADESDFGPVSTGGGGRKTTSRFENRSGARSGALPTPLSVR